MKLTLYQADAFTGKLFGGNPAAIIPLKKWLPEKLMQQIAMENNLAETAFIVPSKHKKADFDIRWFTPEIEINLCGHATLASAFVVLEMLKTKRRKVVFNSKSGPLIVWKDQASKSGCFMAHMDFPSWPPEKISDYPAELLASLGNLEIAGVYQNREFIVELPDQEAVKNCKPDFTLMKKLGKMVIITAPGKDVDFVSRFFAPTAGIDEDPVTGSAHSQLIPFWSYKLGKTKMKAKQLSKREGMLICEQKGERVIMGGECVFYMKGRIQLS